MIFSDTTVRDLRAAIFAENPRIKQVSILDASQNEFSSGAIVQNAMKSLIFIQINDEKHEISPIDQGNPIHFIYSIDYHSFFLEKKTEKKKIL